jgi:hypothetical protein
MDRESHLSVTAAGVAQVWTTNLSGGLPNKMYFRVRTVRLTPRLVARIERELRIVLRIAGRAGVGARNSELIKTRMLATCRGKIIETEGRNPSWSWEWYPRLLCERGL